MILERVWPMEDNSSGRIAQGRRERKKAKGVVNEGKRKKEGLRELVVKNPAGSGPAHIFSFLPALSLSFLDVSPIFFLFFFSFLSLWAYCRTEHLGEPVEYSPTWLDVVNLFMRQHLRSPLSPALQTFSIRRATGKVGAVGAIIFLFSPLILFSPLALCVCVCVYARWVVGRVRRPVGGKRPHLLSRRTRSRTLLRPFLFSSLISLAFSSLALLVFFSLSLFFPPSNFISSWAVGRSARNGWFLVREDVCVSVSTWYTFIDTCSAPGFQCLCATEPDNMWRPKCVPGNCVSPSPPSPVRFSGPANTGFASFVLRASLPARYFTLSPFFLDGEVGMGPKRR